MSTTEIREWKAYLDRRDVTSRNTLIERYLPLLRSVARTMRQTRFQKYELAELASMGFAGLLAAVTRFDPDRNLKFATFARVRIQGAILDAMRVETRSRRRGARMVIHPLEIDLPGPAQVPEDADFWYRACSGLKRQRDRLVVLLYWRMGLSLREVGQQLGVTEGRVCQIVRQLKARFQSHPELLGDEPLRRRIA